MDVTKSFLDAQTLKILNYTSPHTDEYTINNNQLGQEFNLDNGFVEYVISSVFPGLKNQGEYEEFYKTDFYKEEATAVLQIAKQKLPIFKSFEHIRGYNIIFEDENPFLGGQDNAYGKLIMKIVNRGVIPYRNKDDVLYDIYAAGSALQALYLKHVGLGIEAYLNNPMFYDCRTYYDVYISVLTVDPSLVLQLLPKDVILQAINFKGQLPNQWRWVLDEFNRVGAIGFFMRVYNTVEREIQLKYVRQVLIKKFKPFVAQVIGACSGDDRTNDVRKTYLAEMEIMFGSDSDHLFALAKKLHYINSDSYPEEHIMIREINKIVFVPVNVYIDNSIPPITIDRFNTSEDLGFLGFVSPLTNIGSLAYRKMMDGLKLVSTRTDYQELVNEYTIARRAIFRCKFSNVILAIVNPLKNKTDIQAKKVIFVDETPFFGGTDNFVGKAIEIVYREASELHMPDSSTRLSPKQQSPRRRSSPSDPFYYDTNQSPKYNPLSPGGVPTKYIYLRQHANKTAKFMRSTNVNTLSELDFTISFPTGIDRLIMNWVHDQFNTFVNVYVFIYNNFAAPTPFDLEIFFRRVFKPYINTLVDKTISDSLSALFKPNNDISKLFIDLITTNLVVGTDNLTTDVAKFKEFQSTGLQMLQNTDDIKNKYYRAERTIYSNLSTFFELKDSHNFVPYVFGVAINFNKDKASLSPKQINRINFWGL